MNCLSHSSTPAFTRPFFPQSPASFSPGPTRCQEQPGLNTMQKLRQMIMLEKLLDMFEDLLEMGSQLGLQPRPGQYFPQGGNAQMTMSLNLNLFAENFGGAGPSGQPGPCPGPAKPPVVSHPVCPGPAKPPVVSHPVCPGPAKPPVVSHPVCPGPEKPPVVSHPVCPGPEKPPVISPPVCPGPEKPPVAPVPEAAGGGTGDSGCGAGTGSCGDGDGSAGGCGAAGDGSGSGCGAE